MSRTDTAPPALPAPAPTTHGHTVAAWVCVVVVLVGAVVLALAVVLPAAWLAWAGGAIIVAGLVLGWVLSVLGYGKPAKRGASA